MKDDSGTPSRGSEVMRERLYGDMLLLDGFDGKSRRPRCLDGGDIGDPVVHGDPHDLVVVLSRLFIRRGVDDHPDLSPPEEVYDIG